MPARTRILPVCLCHVLVLLLCLFTVCLAKAQTLSGSADKAREAERSTESTPGTDPIKVVPIDPEATQPGPAANVSNSPVDPKETKDNKADPTKVQPLTSPEPLPPAQCKRVISADIVALPQPIMLNRLGAAVPDGLVFALKSDTVGTGDQIRLLPGKRPRPLVLRANVGDCLTVTFTNAIPKDNFGTTKVPGAAINTTEVSLHVEGMEWAKGSQDDGSFTGVNNSSLASVSPAPSSMPPSTQAYNLYAGKEGTFLLYTMGDTSTQGLQLMRGLFGALNVEPAGAEWYRSQVTADDLAAATYNANKPDQVPPSTLTCTGPNCTFKLNGKQVKVFKTPSGSLNTLDNHPLINYDAKYADGTPILKMLDAKNRVVHTDLTAIITGPKAGRFPGTTGPDKPEPPCNAENNSSLNPGNVKVDPLFCQNPASPDRKQPYREVTIIYHEMMDAVTAQAFPVFGDPTLKTTLSAGKDAFAINYGIGGIGAEVYANRIGVGPMGDCVDCKFEEFFLSAWSVGDPAMLVDKPANSNNLAKQSGFQPPCGLINDFNSPPCGGQRVPAVGSPYTMTPTAKATVAYFPDDPSNVYHSYINDHLKFRILHGGTGVTHVHHQHAHQWLQSPNSDEGSYLDSQMISPGATYTLEMVYNGSGNRNKVVGDSIFHCHFYPHFASGMWAMWRTHDVFESGTFVYPQGTTVNGKDVSGQVVPGARALPDGEIIAGAPTPAIVPLPTLPMAPLPAYAQIQNNVKVQGADTHFGGQVVIGGTCQGNKINGLDVIGGCTNGQMLNGTVISSQFNGTQLTGQFQPSPANQLQNPGFPFFIPGIAGARAPHPPLDFAVDATNGGVQDGGLPRHVVSGGSISYERHNAFDWSKDLATMNAAQLPEEGTDVEKAAMKFFGKRCYATSFPDGTPGNCPPPPSTSPQTTLNQPPTGFLLNGLPRGPQPGAPFADPAVDDNGKPIGSLRTYKAAAIQLNVAFNKKSLGWHFPQERMLTLWNDVQPSIDYSFGKPGRAPEPLFFRGNSGDIIEYWHTNLVPNYYLVDDFQVRTPTDILGQHIHLVKFDVTSSDGAGNGFNYEDGTFSPQEVQETIKAINAAGGITVNNAKQMLPAAKMPPKEILDCASNPNDPRCTLCPDNWTDTSRPQCPSWRGAQTTIQRWYLDPLVDDSNVDRTMRTVFTHDHFGPSTHQQAGLYAGLLIEPLNSKWRNSENGSPMGVRPDGGPTSWKADILTTDKNNKDVSYREFAMEFQDFQLAYQVNKLPGQPPAKFADPNTPANPDPNQGYRDKAYALGAPSTPTLISTGTVGTQSVNYLNEPIPWRVGNLGDLSNAYNSATVQAQGLPPNGDPITPQLRAYQGDNVQIRTLVGAHMFAHQFNLHGPTWFAEPSWKNSGFRSAQAMGLSEHFELLFKVPSSSAPNTGRKCPDGTSAGNCADYLYSPSLDDTGIANGMWGLFRAYDPNKVADKLQPLPNNPVVPNANVTYATCPVSLQAPATKRVFNVTAVTAQKALALRSPQPEDPTKGQIVFNDRDGGNPQNALRAKLGIMYVRTEDLDAQGRLKPGIPIEPLILRANAGDCIEVNLTNGIDPASDIFSQQFQYQAPLTNVPAPSVSKVVGLHPQLLSYDAAVSTGVDVGYNSVKQGTQAAQFGGAPKKYQWYAGKIDRDISGNLNYTPVEFGSLNLFPSDPLFQHINGLFGAMIVEPAGSSWKCDARDNGGNLVQVPCDPTTGFDPTQVKDYTRAAATTTLADNATKFREFAVMISDAMRISQGNSSAVNYRTEPRDFRFANVNTNGDFSCMASNQLIQQAQKDPKTPIFTAEIGDRVRFRMMHPFGTGTSQVFTLHGHAWQRNPYRSDSTQIGDNNLSQWLGSRDNHGATDHFELLVAKAGGEGGQAGDYLYTVYLPSQAALGAWGIFRVGHSNGTLQPNAACKPAPSGGQYVPPKPQPDVEKLIREPVNSTPKP